MEVNGLLAWMREREDVRRAKHDGMEKPWSADLVFQETYFCNVHREDDRVTKWIRGNWPGSPCSPNTHAVAMALARFVNKPSTLGVLEYPTLGFTLAYCNHFVHTMNGLKKPWGNAYLVSTNGNRMPKEQYIARVMQEFQDTVRKHRFTTLANAHACFTSVSGIGSFMSGQIIADLKNTPGHPLYGALDWDDWCAHGPGSLRGMAWIMGKEKCSPADFYREMPVLLAQVRAAGWDIHAQDLQNCLCEYDKYSRVKNGTGRSKRKYDARGDGSIRSVYGRA